MTPGMLLFGAIVIGATSSGGLGVGKGGFCPALAQYFPGSLKSRTLVFLFPREGSRGF